MKTLPTVSKSLGVLLMASMSCGTLSAQDSSAPKTWLRLLPLGEPPPYEEKIQDNKRMQQDAPPGSTPPEKVQLPATGKDKIPEVSLRLDQMTGPISARVGLVPLREMQGGAANPVPWKTLKLPARTASLGLLWRKPGAKTWDEPMGMALPDDTSAFPLGRIRMINITPWTAAVMIGKNKPVQLKPGQKFVQAAPTGGLKQAPVLIKLLGKGNVWKDIGARTLTQTTRQRTNVVIYVADGVDPRFPANVYVRAETPRFPSKHK